MKKEYRYKDANNAEEILLEYFKTLNSGQETEVPDLWEVRYHIDKKRQNILNWFDFGKDKSLLEIGAGCGALTELFCEEVDEVTAVEISKLRSEILTERCKSYSNLTVTNENLSDFSSHSKFDYVTSIGVLEYSGKTIDSDSPFLEFLELAKSFLKEDGKLIVAIENKYGLKYWAGAPEDHVNRIFEGIENYPNKPFDEYSGIQTFSRKELQKLLSDAGFSKTFFYYPLPDYKFPKEIFSDDYLPSEENMHKPNAFEDFVRDYNLFINLEYAAQGIVRNDQFTFFANSFLVVAEI